MPPTVDMLTEGELALLNTIIEGADAGDLKTYGQYSELEQPEVDRLAVLGLAEVRTSVRLQAKELRWVLPTARGRAMVA